MPDPSLADKITMALSGSRLENSASAPRTGSLRSGWLWVASAKLVFIITSYGTQLALPRLLGSVREFGRLSTALNVAALVNNVLVVSSIQTVSRFVSQGDPPQVLRQGLRLQGSIGLGLTLLAWTTAPWVAGHLLLDASLAPLLGIASLLLFAYALYGAGVGYLNGQQQFVRQARNDIGFSLLRMLGIGGAAAMGWGASGAMGGFALACLAITAVLLLRIGTGQASEVPLPWRRWLVFMAPLWLYQLSLNGLQQVDLLLLKRGTASLAMAAGMDAAAAAAQASHQAGLYRAAQLFAFVPYQLALSLTWVLYPAFARALSTAEPARVRQLLHQSLRASWLLVAACVAPMAGAADGLLRLAFPPAYQPAAGALRVLVVGLGFFSCFVVVATLLTSGGQVLAAAGIGAAALLLMLLLLQGALHLPGLPGSLLERVAAATSLACLAACLAALLVLQLRYRAGLPRQSLLRGGLAALLAALLAAYLPHHTPSQTLLALAAGAAAFALTLLALGELNSAEWQRLRSKVAKNQG